MPSPNTNRSPLGVVFFTVFLDLIGFGIVLPLLPGFAAEHQAQEWQIGLLMATYSLMQFVFSPIWGRLSDRIGRRPVLLVSITGSALSYTIFAFAPSLALLFVSRIVAGIMAANIATAQAYVADVTTPENRVRGMGMIGAAFGLGFILGPALAGFLSHWAEGQGLKPQLVVGLAAAGFSFLDLLFAAARLPESLTPELRARARAPQGTRLERMAAALRSPALGSLIAVFFLSTVAWSQLEPTLVLLIRRPPFEFDAAKIGYLFAYVGIISALVQGGFAGRMARKSGEARLILTGTLCLALALAAVPMVASVGGLYAVLGFLALGQAMNLPGLQSLISRSAAADQQGATLGVTQGFSSLARVVGPALGGFLYGIHHAYPFWSGAAMMVVAFLLAGRAASRVRHLATDSGSSR
jgi:DHA1 family tetracycline resistance protein-like MFS transporter